MPWICPECNRKFARNKQARSCESYALDPLFVKSNPGVRALYDSLIRIVSTFGPVDIRVGSYIVSLRNLSTFMSIFPERNHLTITFIRDEALDEFPVYQTYQQSKNRWANHIKIESREEIDDQLIGWLKEAFVLSGG